MKKIIKDPWFWGIVALTIFALAARFWRLGTPNEYVFDEVYYAKWAQNYLVGTGFFDVHPPIAKLIISISEKFFGDNGFGWRAAEAFFGTLVIPLIYSIANKLLNNKRIAFLTALFCSLDGLLLVQSRTALLDSPLVAFSLLAYWSFLNFRDSKEDTEKAHNWLLLTSLFIGLTVSSKWTGAAPVGTILVFYWGWKKHMPKVSDLFAIICFFVIPIMIYLLSFSFDAFRFSTEPTSYFGYLVEWHKQTWNFHHTLTATHPYMSRWWSWLYIARPVWYYFKDNNGMVSGIVALGNPLLWWLSIPALLATIVMIIRRKAVELLLPLIAFLAAYVPWWFIGRTQFQYYVVGGVPFMFMILAWWFDKALDKPLLKPTALLLIGAAVGLFVYFFPLLTAYPVTSHYYQMHLWFHSWI